MAEWLQYGSLGLLAVVLVAIGAGAREALGRWQERERAKLNHQAEADRQQAQLAAQRQEAADTFLRDLIAKDREERTVQLQAWHDLVAEDIEAKQKLTEAIQGLCDRQDAHEERADERHQKMLVLFEQQRKELS